MHSNIQLHQGTPVITAADTRNTRSSSSSHRPLFDNPSLRSVKPPYPRKNRRQLCHGRNPPHASQRFQYRSLAP
jgi:hypothetical protein